MPDFVAHFDVEDDDQTVTETAPLSRYMKDEGYFEVEVNGEIDRYDIEQLQTIRYQKYEDDSQEALF